jgi:phage baseplate assembly protein W
MAYVNEIRARDWSLSLTEQGKVAEGIADISQCIFIILSTDKGSDPLRPEFGSNIFQYIDAPINVAAANIVKAIVEAIRDWEKRVTVVRVKYRVDVSNIIFQVDWKFNNTVGTTEFDLFNRTQGPATGGEGIGDWIIETNFEVQ